MLFCFLFVFSWISPREPVPDRNGGTRRAYCVFVFTICIRFSSLVSVLILRVIRRVSSSLHRIACEVELCVRFELAEVSCMHNNEHSLFCARASRFALFFAEAVAILFSLSPFLPDS